MWNTKGLPVWNIMQWDSFKHILFLWLKKIHFSALILEWAIFKKTNKAKLGKVTLLLKTVWQSVIKNYSHTLMYLKSLKLIRATHITPSPPTFLPNKGKKKSLGKQILSNLPFNFRIRIPSEFQWALPSSCPSTLGPLTCLNSFSCAVFFFLLPVLFLFSVFFFLLIVVEASLIPQGFAN